MKLINDYGEKKVELYYKNNYRGGKSKEYEDLCFEESGMKKVIIIILNLKIMKMEIFLMKVLNIILIMLLL